MENIKKILSLLIHSGGKLMPPACLEQIREAEKVLGTIPEELKEFYLHTNGVELNSWRVLPIYDEDNIKNTWDSIERANNVDNTKFSLNDEMLKQFLIFSEIRGAKCVMYNKATKKIWIETQEEYVETDLNLLEFMNFLIAEEIED